MCFATIGCPVATYHGCSRLPKYSSTSPIRSACAAVISLRARPRKSAGDFDPNIAATTRCRISKGGAYSQSFGRYGSGRGAAFSS